MLCALSQKKKCYVPQQVPKPLENELLEKIREIDLKTLLDKSCPERSSLINYFMSYKAM
jgi:hypothetical protein